MQPKLEVLYTRREIGAAVQKLADEINRDYAGKETILVGILKGSFVFLADLMRLLDIPLEVEFVGFSSYGCETQTSGKVQVVKALRCPIEGRHVIVIEDIADTGLTTAFALEYLKGMNPASLKLCVLFDKPSRRRVEVHIDYRGLQVPDKFLVGYGLDYNEKYRNLPDMCYLQ